MSSMYFNLLIYFSMLVGDKQKLDVGEQNVHTLMEFWGLLKVEWWQSVFLVEILCKWLRIMIFMKRSYVMN